MPPQKSLIMKFTTSIVIYLLLPFLCFSQNNQRSVPKSEIDSLLKVVKEVSGKDEIYTYINISRYYSITNDVNNGIKYGIKAVECADSMNLDTLVAQSQLFLGIAYNIINPDSGLKYFILSSDYLSSVHHPWAGFGYENAIGILINKGWFTSALDYAYKSVKNYEYHKDTIQISIVYRRISDLFQRMEQYDNSKKYLERAYDLIKGKNRNEDEGMIYGSIGIDYDEQGIYDSALYYNQLAIEYFKKDSVNFLISIWRSNIANTYIKMGEYDKAEKYLIMANDKYLQGKLKSQVYVNFANVYNKKKKYNLSLKMLDSARVYANKFKRAFELSEVLYRTYELYEQKQDYKTALEYFKQYSILDDSLHKENTANKIAQLEIKYETQKKERKIAAQKLEISQTKLKVSNKNKWIIGISLMGLSIILFVLYFMQRNKRKAAQEKSEAIIEEQEKGLVAVFNAQEEERARVAKDLHDGIGQQISAISLNFQMLSDKIITISEELKTETGKVKKMIQDTGTDIRNISHQMMPRALTEYGLIDAMEDLVEKSFLNGRIAYSFEHHNMEERLPKNLEIGLYRITQELINNIIKHSEAKNVGIELLRNKNYCILIVQDDGIGLKNDSRDGVGIRNMNSRLNALKGELNLESDSKNGTTAFVKIKLV